MEEKDIEAREEAKQIIESILKNSIKKSLPDQATFLEYLTPYLSNISIENDYRTLLPILFKMGMSGIESLVQIYIGSIESMTSNPSVETIEAGLKLSIEIENRFGKERANMTAIEFQNKVMNSFSFEDLVAFGYQMEKPMKLFLNEKIEGLEQTSEATSEEENALLGYFIMLITKVWYRYLMTQTDTDLHIKASKKKFLVKYFKSMNTFYGKETFPRHLIDYIDSIYVPEQKEIIDITPKPAIQLPQDSKQLTAGIPIFHQQEDIHEALKKYFPAEQHDSLVTLLQGKTINDRLFFLGQSNQLADIFRKLLDSHFIIGCNNKEMITWLTLHFEYKGLRGKATALKEKHLSNVISGHKIPCKNPLIEIEEDTTTKKMVFTLGHHKAD